MNLIRNIVGLLIILSLLPLSALSFRYVADISFNYDEVNNEIAICQLRELLLIAYDIEISDSQLNFRYKNADYHLCLVNRKMLLQPGTQIYLNDIDDLHFFSKNDCIYISYEKDNKRYERVIASQTGIYLDDFSTCDVQPECSDSYQD